jgi:hypothetical protein
VSDDSGALSAALSALSALAERVAAGERPEALVVSLLPRATRETLRRCAVPACFDRGLYERRLRGGRTGPQLDELVKLGQVERVHPSSQWYRVAAHLHTGSLESWWSVGEDRSCPPKALRAFAAELVTDHEAEENQPELLRQLLLATDSATARRRFEELFDSAYLRFELGRCQDLLQAVLAPDRDRFVRPGLRASCEQRWWRLQARSMWAADYQQTSSYQSRPAAEAALLELLEPDPGGPRLVQVCGPGGYGKTMQLRWFVARQCLAHVPPVPCARVDCDGLDADVLTEHPWLLLLPMAEQLNRQLPDEPFRELLIQHERYREALRSPGQRGTAVVDLTNRDLLAADRDDVVARFVAELGSDRAPSDVPVVLLLDTLEEVAWRPPDGLEWVLGLLRQILQVPRVRVVLSSRVDIAARLEAARSGRFAELFPSARTVELRPFEPAEARRYLAGRRIRPELMDAVIRSAEGMPFILALYADLGDGLTDTDIDQDRQLGDGPWVAYLVGRGLGKIRNETARWLLCLGVVLRQLTFDLFTEVLAPQAGRAAQPVPDPEELPALWEELLEHARTSPAWLEIPVGSPTRLVINPNARGPLRNHLLRKGILAPEALRNLHQRAAEYHDRLATGMAGDDQWQAATREALYHRFQLGEDDDFRAALDGWWRAVEAAHDRGRDDLADELVEDLLSAERSGDLSGPGAGLQVPVLTPRMHYHAHLGRAWLLTQRANGQPDTAATRTWGKVEAELKEAAALAAGGQGVSDPRYTLLRAQQLAAAGRYGEAVDVAEELTGSLAGVPGTVRRDALLVQADALVSQPGGHSAQRAVARYHQAHEQARLHGGAVEVALRVAEYWLGAGSPREAVTWCDRAERDAGIQGPGDAVSWVVELTRARALLVLGRPAEALAALSRRSEAAPAEADLPAGVPVPLPPGPAGAAGTPPPRLRYVIGQALLMLRRPVDAIEALRGAVSAGGARAGEDAGWAVSVALLEASAHGALLDFDEALGCLDRAGGQALSDEHAVAVEVARGRFYLHAVGDLGRAAAALDALRLDGLRRGSRTWTNAVLSRAELAVARDEADAARTILQDAVTAVERPGVPVRLRARAVLWRASLLPDGQRHLPALREALADVEPAARLPLLGHLPWRWRPAEVDGAERGRWEVWLGEARSAQLGVDARAPRRADDGAVLDLSEAAFGALLGADPGDLPARAATQLAARDPYVWWDVLTTFRGTGGDPAALAGSLPGFLDRYQDRYGVLAGAYRLQLAIRLPAGPPATSAPAAEPGPSAAAARRAWLEGARRQLTAPGLLPSRWQAQLYETLARHGAPAADIEDGGTQQHASAAAALWTRLGDTRRRDLGVRSTGVGPPRSAVTPHPGEAVLQLAASGGVITVSGRIGGRRLVGSRQVPVLHSAGAMSRAQLVELLLAPGAERVREWVVDLSEQLGAVPDGTDVRVEATDPLVAALPWESLLYAAGTPLAAHQAVGCLYRGVVGSAYLGQPPPAPAGVDGQPDDRQQARVLAVWPVANNLRRLRGIGAAVDMARNAYRAHNVEVIDWTNRRGQTGADVVHILAPVEIEPGTRAPVIDLGGETRLRIAELDRLVRRETRGAPLVILDIPQTTNPVESAHQLLRRNELAHRLVALGNVPAILCPTQLGSGTTGYGREPGPVSGQLGALVARGIATRRAPAEIWHDLRAEAHAPPAGRRSAAGIDLALGATVLFSHGRPRRPPAEP